MNQIVIFENEICHKKVEFKSSDDRYQHLVKVLKVKTGSILKGCILNQGHVTLTLSSIDQTKLILELGSISITNHNQLNLILGLSRPPSIKKVFEHGSCMGINHFTVVKTKLSEKSFLASKVFKEDSISKLFHLGLSQSVQHFNEPKFELLDHYKKIDFSKYPKSNRFILCPSATNWLNNTQIDFTKDITLAIGCERGFTSSEEIDFQQQKFIPIKISSSILRVEIAVYSILSQLELLRSQND